MKRQPTEYQYEKRRIDRMLKALHELTYFPLTPAQTTAAILLISKEARDQGIEITGDRHHGWKTRKAKKS